MQNSTHFIEVWKTDTGTTIQTGMKEIINLDRALFATRAVKGLETIAIWEIALKPLYEIIN